MIHFLADAAASPHTFQDMFVLPVSVLEKVLRTIAVYVFLIVGLRIAGKRELAQLNPLDLIVLLLLSNTVQNAIIGDDNSVTGGVIGAGTLLIVNYCVVRVVHRSRKLQRIIEGRRDVLIKNGEIRSEHLDRELISRADLRSAALKQGISSLDDVETCVLEPTGALSFVEKKPTHEAQLHTEIMAALEELRKDLALLHKAMAAS
ncbi:MAG: DUF421 domain-containing protein [Phycisphaerae bacterium]|nr:DUF421 domain-containing protein [Phycisphaerae bacterium]